jgi:3-oxoadipate enol-lactonase
MFLWNAYWNAFKQIVIDKKPHSMKMITSDGIELHYQTYGEKNHTPVILIHGLGADQNMWKPQIEVFPGKDMFLIVPDMRGHGQTSKVDAFRISDCARDIQELLDHLQIKTAAIAGVSMGGVIAQQFACDFPELTEKLIVCDSFSEVSSFAEKTGGWMQWLTIKIAPQLMVRSLGSVYKGSDNAETLQYFIDSFSKTDKKQLLKARAALNRFYITPKLKHINVPSLVLVGDGFGDFAMKMAKKTANNITGSHFKILKGGFDPSNMVVADSFNSTMLHFLE